MKQVKIELPNDVKYIINKFNKHNFKAYVVGGCVRDSILNKPIHDWDICTDATPDEMLNIFSDKKILLTGIKHGTITVMLNHIGYEITTFRIDGEYSDNRRPDKVEYTTDITKDLSRRDFTMNAMAYNDEDGLIDLFNGIDDINKKTIKCVNDPNERLQEDALRMMRAIRFSAKYKFDLDLSLQIAIINNASLINNVSNERINSEFSKFITQDTKYVVDNIIKAKSLFFEIIPELKACNGFEQNNPYHIFDVLGHTLDALKHCETNDLYTRLAILLHDIGKPYCCVKGEDGYNHFKGHGKISANIATDILKRLKFDNNTIKNVVELIFYHDVTFEVSKKCVKRWLNKIGKEQFYRLLELRKCDVSAQNSLYLEERIKKVDNIKTVLEEVLTEKECFSLKDLAINGNDLISIGYKPGKEIGIVLNEILSNVMDDLPNEKSNLLSFAKTKLEQKNKI